jgi:hypothetical protein
MFSFLMCINFPSILSKSLNELRMGKFWVLHQIGKVPLPAHSIRSNRKKIKMGRTRDLKKGATITAKEGGFALFDRPITDGG